MRYHLLWILLLPFLFCCSSKEPLIVYTDPSLSDRTELLCSSFSAKTDNEVKIVELSSEVAAQHLRYGQPMDIWIMAQPSLTRDPRVSAKLLRSRDMGGDQVVKVECLSRERAVKVVCDSCWMKAASGTPLRDYTDAWLSASAVGAGDGHIVIANFYPQVQEYLLRGWVKGGYVWKSFADAHKDQLKILQTGPRVEPLYQLWEVKTGRNPAAAAEFLELSGYK